MCKMQKCQNTAVAKPQAGALHGKEAPKRAFREDALAGLTRCTGGMCTP